LRNTDIVDHLSSQGIFAIRLFSLYSIDDPGKSISRSILSRLSSKQHDDVTVHRAVTSERSQSNITPSKTPMKSLVF
jgi:hypothetical protein